MALQMQSTVKREGKLELGLVEVDVPEPREGEVLVHCKLGGRSAKAVAYLQEQGIIGATNVEGGIEAWLHRGA